MSGEELFKFNSNKGIDFSKFKLKLDSTNAAETKKNIFFSIFDKDNNQIIDSDEISELFGTFLGYAAIQGDKYTIDSDEAELMLNFIADKNGESLKAKGFSVKEVVDFIKNIQNQGNKTFERKQEADFQKQVNSVKQAIFYSDIDEKELKVSYKDVEAYARAVTGIHSKKELTEKEAQTLTNKIIELQLLNGPDFKYTAGATVASKGKKISQTILNLLKQRGITPNADTHGIFLAMAKCNDCVELYDMLKLFKKYEIKTTKEFQNAIKQQRSQDLQNYTAEVLIANIKEAIKILQQTEDNMGISFETAGEYIKKGIYAIFGWDRAKPISESKKELQDKLKLFETQLRMSLNNGTFKQTFKKLTGITYNEEKVEDFIEFSKKQNEKATIQPRCGEIGAMYAITDNINYQLKMKETFGIDFTRQAQDAQFRSADDGAGLELIAMIGLMAKFSASSVGRSFSSAVLKATARVLPKGLAKVAAPSIISGTTLGAFTGTTQIVRNLTKKAPTTKQDWQNTGWATLQSFGLGKFAYDSARINEKKTNKIFRIIMQIALAG